MCIWLPLYVAGSGSLAALSSAIPLHVRSVNLRTSAARRRYCTYRRDTHMPEAQEIKKYITSHNVYRQLLVHSEFGLAMLSHLICPCIPQTK